MGFLNPLWLLKFLSASLLFTQLVILATSYSNTPEALFIADIGE
jgi:hypothetical protein